MVYLIPIILFAIGVVRYDYLKVTKGKIFLFALICLYLILLAGLRYRLGEDTIYYLSAYEKINPLNKLSEIDFQRSRYAPGFIILFSFFKMLTPEMTVFQLFQATVVNTVFFYFFYKNCRNIFFCGLLYYVFLYILLSFLQMRESLAVSIFLLAWPAFKQGKWLIWYFAALLAFSMHMSAIIMFFLPLICLPGIRNAFIFDKRIWLIVLLIIVVGYAIQVTFFKYLELLSLTEKMQERAQAYDKDALGGSLLNIKGIISLLFEYVIYPVLALYSLKETNKLNRKKGEFNKLQAFVLINTYIVLFSIFISIALRLTNYFYPFVIIFLGDWLFTYIRIGNKKLRLNLIGWIIFLLPMIGLHAYGLTFAKINKSGTIKTYMLYYPYHSYFEQGEDPDKTRALRHIFRPARNFH